MSAYIEVVAAGFDGSTDETDDRVLWVVAPSLEYVKALLADIPHQQATVLEMDPHEDDFDFTLPGDDLGLVSSLKYFSASAV